jgi:hypothetical protein
MNVQRCDIWRTEQRQVGAAVIERAQRDGAE